MKECPYCGKPVQRHQATCEHCRMPIGPGYLTPSELAAQTTKPLRKLLARPPSPQLPTKNTPLETRRRTLTT